MSHLRLPLRTALQTLYSCQSNTSLRLVSGRVAVAQEPGQMARAKKGKRQVSDDEPVFLSSKGRPNWDHRWSWRKALKKAGLHLRKRLTLYSLRHSFATHYLERGSPSDLQQLLGHASYATTERYVRAVAERARAGIEALDVAG